MIPEELETEIEKCLERGHVPFMVNATCGTTVLGAYDPLESLADICGKHNVWLHVDVSISLSYCFPNLVGKGYEKFFFFFSNRLVGEVVHLFRRSTEDSLRELKGICLRRASLRCLIHSLCLILESIQLHGTHTKCLGPHCNVQHSWFDAM